MYYQYGIFTNVHIYKYGTFSSMAYLPVLCIYQYGIFTMAC